MRHAKRTLKLGKTSSHRRCMFANMLKSLVEHERIETSMPKAKELKRRADKMITRAKKGSLSDRRALIADLMVRYNTLTPKERRAAKNGDTTSYNGDRKVISKLFDDLSKRYQDRPGGYTRIIKTGFRIGDQQENCVVEFI